MTTTPSNATPPETDPDRPDPAATDPAATDPEDTGPGEAGDEPGAQPVDPRRPGARAGEKLAEGDEETAERYADSPGAGLAGALDDLPEPNEPG